MSEPCLNHLVECAGHHLGRLAGLCPDDRDDPHRRDHPKQPRRYLVDVRFDGGILCVRGKSGHCRRDDSGALHRRTLIVGLCMAAYEFAMLRLKHVDSSETKLEQWS